MRKIVVLILIGALMTAMLSGCTVFTKAKSTAGASTAEAFVPKSLGRATFTVDTAKKDSAQFTADGTDTTVSVTDRGGLTWTLVIPEDALLEPTTITITAMSSVSVDTLGKLAGGVVFEPDGLTFLAPAKLTVTGKGMTTHSLLMTGQHDGANLALAGNEKVEGGVSADIYHFSSAMMSNGGDAAQITGMENQASENYSEAMKKAADLLKQKIDDSDIPPDISLKCKKGTHDLDINKYYGEFLKKLKEPEMTVVTELLAAERSKQYMGTSNDNNAYEVAAKLLDRLRTKVSKIISKYKNQPDKFYATAAAFIQVERLYGSVGGKGAADWEPLRQWCKTVAQKYLNELKQHDYTSIHALVRASRILDLIGGDGQAFQAELQNALKFNLNLEIKMRTLADNYIKYEINSEIPIQLTLSLEGGLAVGDGTGTCTYALAETPLGVFGGPKTYECTVEITEFDPCTKDVVKLSLDNIGAPEETWHYNTGMSVTDDNTSQYLGGMLFAEEGATAFDFSLPLKNMNVNAVDETLDKTEQDGGLKLEGTMHVTLVHK